MKMLHTGEGVGRWGEVVGWILVYEIPVYAHPLFLSELLCELVGFILQPKTEEKWWWSLGGCDWGPFGREEGCGFNHKFHTVLEKPRE